MTPERIAPPGLLARATVTGVPEVKTGLPAPFRTVAVNPNVLLTGVVAGGCVVTDTLRAVVAVTLKGPIWSVLTPGAVAMIWNSGVAGKGKVEFPVIRRLLLKVATPPTVRTVVVPFSSPPVRGIPESWSVTGTLLVPTGPPTLSRS